MPKRFSPDHNTDTNSEGLGLSGALMMMMMVNPVDSSGLYIDIYGFQCIDVYIYIYIHTCSCGAQWSADGYPWSQWSADDDDDDDDG